MAEDFRLQLDGVEADEDTTLEYANMDYLSKEPQAPRHGEVSQHENDISESVMWYEIQKEQMFDEGKLVDALKKTGATISSIFEIIAPVEARHNSKFRITFPIDPSELPAIQYGSTELGKKSVRKIFCAHCSKKHGIHFSQPEFVSEDGSEVSIVVNHFSSFFFFTHESAVLMLSYDDKFGQFNALCCKESFFIGQDNVNILESSSDERLLMNAKIHKAHNQQILDQTTNDIQIREESKRSVEAAEFLINCIKSDYRSWKIVPITGKGKYQYRFQDENGADIHTSSKFRCRLDKVVPDQGICTAEKKDKIETFSLNMTKWFGTKYGPFLVSKLQKLHEMDASMDSIKEKSARVTTSANFSIRIDFDKALTLDDAKKTD